MNAVISADRVSKRFVVAQWRPAAGARRPLRRRRAAAELWALRDVSFQVGQGETVALLRRNGSGKSTLLCLLRGILAPTSGRLNVRGRVASLIELGAGFNGELTGRENVYLNASILGLTRREVDRRFAEIVEFSGLERFIDNQVKHFSTGMYVRLGFAVAAHVDPDVLLVDEVLAVGDDAFQQKCLAKVAEFQAQGRTIVFVTHALDLAPRICQRGILLEEGTLRHDGPVTETVRRTRALLGGDPTGGAADAADGPRISGVHVVGGPPASATLGSGRLGEVGLLDAAKDDELVGTEQEPPVGLDQQPGVTGEFVEPLSVEQLLVLLVGVPAEQVRPGAQGVRPPHRRVRGGQHDPPVGLEQAGEPCQPGARVGDVLDECEGGHRVEALLAGDRRRESEPGARRTRLVQGALVDVDAEVSLGPADGGKLAVAAAIVEHASPHVGRRHPETPALQPWREHAPANVVHGDLPPKPTIPVGSRQQHGRGRSRHGGGGGSPQRRKGLDSVALAYRDEHAFGATDEGRCGVRR